MDKPDTDAARSSHFPAWKRKAVTHDAAGHLTEDGSGKTYVYNQAGQLSQVKQGTTLLATYYYNYLGERSRKVTSAAVPQGAQTVLYHYDQQSHLIAETSGTGAPLRTYVWRDEAPLAQIEYVPSRRVLYYELDQTNTPRAAEDATGKVVWRWESDAFGSSAANEDPDGDGVKTTVNLRFPGQYYDAETGLHQNYFRDYDPRVGRYVESDPIGLEGGLNPYAYVRGNPMSRIDPFGLYHFVGNAKGPITAQTAQSMSCMDDCLGRDIAITSANDGTHSGPKDLHLSGQACDVGKNSNPGLKRDKVKACFIQCFPAKSSYGQEEGNHYHLQTRPGLHGSTGFPSGIR